MLAGLCAEIECSLQIWHLHFSPFKLLLIHAITFVWYKGRSVSATNVADGEIDPGV